MLKFLKVSADFKRPVIYTFVHVEESNTSLEQISILVWAEAWADAGWDPVVLTEIDSSHHPDYEHFVKKLSSSGYPQSAWSRFLRYLAMSSQANGGYYTQIHVLPIQHALSFYKNGFQFPNEGKFTMYDGFSMSLTSGSKQEWNRITSAIIHAEKEKIHNDVSVLRSLNLENPSETLTEFSFVDVMYVLGLKEKSALEVKPLCKHLQNKVATMLRTGVRSVGFSNHSDYYKALKSSLNKCKPIMHTYFELAYGKNSEKSLLIELEEWKKAWVGAGWSPIVLALADAKRHPLYEEFRIAFQKAEYQTDKYDQMCFYRWLAMAASPDGGWMSDYDTYPLNLYHNTDSSYNLPNNGTFTSNMFFVPNLISGSKSEWNRMAELLLTNYKDHTTLFWSDMFALKDINEKQTDAFIFTYDAIELSTIYSNPPRNKIDSVTDYGDAYVDKAAARNFPFELKKFCFMTEGKLAVHFSHASCYRTGFCHNNRGPNLNKWLNTWRRQCFYDE